MQEIKKAVYKYLKTEYRLSALEAKEATEDVINGMDFETAAHNAGTDFIC